MADSACKTYLRPLLASIGVVCAYWSFVAGAAEPVAGEPEPMKAVAAVVVEQAVHRPADAIATSRINALSPGMVLLRDAPHTLIELADAYAAALPLPGREPLRPGIYSLVMVGPLLDGPDSAVIRNVRMEHGDISIDLSYTHVRTQGMNLRRNLQWRPVAQIHLMLDAGQYTVHAVWHALASLPDGQALDLPDIEQTLAVSIIK